MCVGRREAWVWEKITLYAKLARRGKGGDYLIKLWVFSLKRVKGGGSIEAHVDMLLYAGML